jgi:hypothetical protein
VTGGNLISKILPKQLCFVVSIRCLIANQRQEPKESNLDIQSKCPIWVTSGFDWRRSIEILVRDPLLGLIFVKELWLKSIYCPQIISGLKISAAFLPIRFTDDTS